jgi:hypothetical protein
MADARHGHYIPVLLALMAYDKIREKKKGKRKGQSTGLKTGRYKLWLP